MAKGNLHRFRFDMAIACGMLAFLLLFVGVVSVSADVLWGSSSSDVPNPSSLFTIDTTTGVATFVGSSGLGSRISAIDFDPITGTMYGMRGSATTGAQLLTFDPSTGAGTVVGPLVGPGFNQAASDSGSDALAFAADGTLYAGGWNGGSTAAGKLMEIDPATGAVVSVLPTTAGLHLSGLDFDASGTLWASHGSSALGVLHTIDPSTGAFLTTLTLNSNIQLSDIAFASDNTLYGANPITNQLVTVDTTTGAVTIIGSFGTSVGRISGLTFETPAVVPEPSSLALFGIGITSYAGLLGWRRKRALYSAARQ